MIDRYDQDLLLGYIEDELDASQRATFEQLMAGDEQLASLVAGLVSDRALMRSLPSEEGPAGLTQDLIQGLERQMLLDGPGETAPIPIHGGRDLAASPGGPRWGRILGISSMAAAVLIAAGLVVSQFGKDPLSQAARDLAQRTPNPRTSSPGDSHSENEDASQSPAPLAESAQPAPAAPSREGDLRDEEMLGQDRRADDQHGPREDALVADHVVAPVADHEADAVSGPVALAAQVLGANTNAPQMQLNILSEEPDLTRQQVLDWCVGNGVPVVQAQLANLSTAQDNARDNADDDGGDDAADFGSNQMVLVIEENQIDELLNVVNGAYPVMVYRQNARLDPLAQDDPLVQEQTRRIQAGHRGQVAQVSPVDSDEQALGNTLELTVPADLGNQEQTLQNFSNTFIYSNRIQLAQAQKQNATPPDEAPPAEALLAEDPEPVREPRETRDEFDEFGGDTEDMPDRARLVEDDPAPSAEVTPDSADGSLQREETDTMPPRNDTPQPGGERRDILTDHSGQEDADARALPDALRVTHNGNWLMPQLPLARSTPLWAAVPEPQLVPLVIQFADRQTVDAYQQQVDAPTDTPADAPTDTQQVDAPVEVEVEADAPATPDAEEPPAESGAPAESDTPAESAAE